MKKSAEKCRFLLNKGGESVKANIPFLTSLYIFGQVNIFCI